MEESALWELIESAVAAHGDREDRDRAIVAALSGMSPDEIVGFQLLLHEVSGRSHTWLMWGAAYRIFGWCSDDGFDYFRMWLLSLGRGAFARVVADPDLLAELSQVRRLAGRERRDWTSMEWPGWETLAYAADQAYRRVAGQGISGVVSDRLSAGPRWQRLTDEWWDFEDPNEVEARLPRLLTLFPTTGFQRRWSDDAVSHIDRHANICLW